MWKKEKNPSLHSSNELNIDKNNKHDDFKHTIINFEDDEKEGLNIFKFNDDLFCKNGLPNILKRFRNN